MPDTPKVSWKPNDGNTIKVTLAFEWNAEDIAKTAGMFGAIGSLMRSVLDDEEIAAMHAEFQRVESELRVRASELRAAQL